MMINTSIGPTNLPSAFFFNHPTESPFFLRPGFFFPSLTLPTPTPHITLANHPLLSLFLSLALTRALSSQTS